MNSCKQTSAADDFWRRLLHRWFVEYNPFYIVSAGLVLVGVNLISSSLTGASALVQLGVAAIAEIYAWSLIAAAAWLTRTGCRRPAVMLALLIGVYQCDPTLHTETCAYLGVTGILAASVWLASFVGKLYALAHALHLRPSRTAIALPTFGAVGLLLIPRYLAAAGAAGAESLITCWVFALFAWGLWSRREITSTAPLDSWGQTVLRRAVRATWLTWSVLGLSHVVFWLDELELGPRALLPAFLLLSTRWLNRESSVWCAVTGCVLFVALTMPGLLSVTAFLAAATLALRALREPVEVRLDADSSEASAPYRSAPFEDAPLRSTPVSRLVFTRTARPVPWCAFSPALPRASICRSGLLRGLAVPGPTTSFRCTSAFKSTTSQLRIPSWSGALRRSAWGLRCSAHRSRQPGDCVKPCVENQSPNRARALLQLLVEVPYGQRATHRSPSMGLRQNR